MKPKKLMVNSVLSISLCLASGIENDRHSIVNAFELPNFRPEAQFTLGDTSTLRIKLPKDLVEAALNQVLIKNDNYVVKDTEFNWARLCGMRASIVRERQDVCGNRSGCIDSVGRGSRPMLTAIRINGNWQGKHRERIACIAGRCRHTPWVSVSGNFLFPYIL